MKTSRAPAQSGIALIIVMICVTVLSMLAAAFAYSMKVDTKLARNANADASFYALAQSAVDYCKANLAAQLACGEEPFDFAEGQVWGGGSMGGCSNSVLGSFEKTVDLGWGRFDWTMTDLERKANINLADQTMLDRAMNLVGVDAGDSGPIAASILDWIDRDQNPHIGGTESKYYETLDQPYQAKDGFIDDLSELLLIRGVTAEMYGLPGVTPPPPPPSFKDRLGFPEQPAQRAYLKDLFVPISAGPININNASPEVLQLVPFIDENIAHQIMACRSGQETGVPTPFRNVGEALLCAGLNQQIVGQVQRYFSVRSSTFEVHINAEIGGVKRQYYAILRRNSPRDVQVLTFHWKLNAPVKASASHADAR
jgi:type II secretory pathway component PulK